MLRDPSSSSLSARLLAELPDQGNADGAAVHRLPVLGLGAHPEPAGGSDGGVLRFGTGAGITWGSDPDAEWAETELKAARLVALASAGRSDMVDG